MSLLSEYARSSGTEDSRRMRRIRGRGGIARLLGVALGVSGLVGVGTAVSVLSVSSPAAAAGVGGGCGLPITGVYEPTFVLPGGCSFPVNLCPYGEVTCVGGASSTEGGSATATDGCITVTALLGEGGVVVGQYSSDPEGALSLGTGEYFDVSLPPGSTLLDVVITVDLNMCTPSGGNALEWWNGSAWVPVVSATGPIYSPGPPPTLTVTLDGATSPTPAQLTETPFAVVVASLPAPSLGGSATMNMNGTTSYVVPMVP